MAAIVIACGGMREFYQKPAKGWSETNPERKWRAAARHASHKEKFFALKVLVNGWPLISKRLSLRHPVPLSHIQLRLASFFRSVFTAVIDLELLRGAS